MVLSSSVDEQSFEIYVCVHECACENLLINMLVCENDTIKTKNDIIEKEKFYIKFIFKKQTKKQVHKNENRIAIIISHKHH